MPARISPEDPEAHRTFAIIDALIQTGLILLASVMATKGEDDPIYQAGFALMVVLIIVLAPLSIVSVGYLIRLYLRQRQSWLLLRDALIGFRLALVALFLGFLAYLRLTGAEQIKWAGPFLAVSLVIVAEVPLYMASVYWLRQNVRKKEAK